MNFKRILKICGQMFGRIGDCLFEMFRWVEEFLYL